MHRVRRLAAVLALVSSLAIGGIFPHEHVHVADEHHHHSDAVAHRHFAPHHQAGSSIDDPSTGSGSPRAVSRGDDDRIVWLDDAVLRQLAYRLAFATAILPTVIEAAPNRLSWVPATTLDGSPPHGPPGRVYPLRGPPLPRLI